MRPYERFEKEWAKYIGTSYAVSCNSGTSAIHLALMALRIGPGDEVICPNFTMAAVPFAVAYTGARPVFVDCGEDLNINPALVKEKINAKTKAIIAVHIYGRPCDMRGLAVFGLPVIEDCAEAHGATIGDRRVGSFGLLSCFSFYRNKILHAEEGGAVCTNDKGLAERIKYLKNMAFSADHSYRHEEIGYNYRITNATASVLLERLPKIDKEIARRRSVADSLTFFWEIPRPKGSVVWVKDVIFDIKEERDAAKELYDDTRLFFKPMTTLPMWKDQDVRGLAHDYSERGMYFIL